MTEQRNWREYWERTAAEAASDVEFDRGTSARDPQLDLLARKELLEFIAPRPTDTLFDAGCGTGANLALPADKVKQVFAMDDSAGALSRCARRIEELNLANVTLFQGSVTHLPLGAESVDRVICMSVLQYLDDDDSYEALREFARVLRPGGELILHVKNLASLYLASLRAAKHVKTALGMRTKMEHVRTFGWYVTALRACGFELATYNSFNLLVLEGMPRKLLTMIQRVELSHRSGPIFGNRVARRLGADLKLRARRLS